MVPPSPKARKVVDFSSNAHEKSPPLHHRKPTVFEDKLTKFKEESTPIHFSAATSLSSLTIDDHEEASQVASAGNREPEQLNEGVEKNLEEEPHETDNQCDVEEVKHEVSHEFDDDFLDQDDENDDEILAACIKMGMPSKRCQAIEKYLMYFNNCRLCYRSQKQQACDFRSTSATSSKIEARDKNYRECLSDDSSNISEDDYKILAECIQAGMPKARSGASAAPSITFSRCSSEDKKSCASVRNCEERGDVGSKNRIHIYGCNSHETGLNRDICVRHQAVLKSSCSDCSDDRIVGLSQ